MGYAMEGGIPIVSSGSGDGFMGGGLGGILLGALLFGRGGLGGLGMGGGYAPGVVEGSQSGAISGIQQQLNSLSSQVASTGIHSELNEIEGSIEALNVANLQGIANNAQLYQSGNAAIQTSLANSNFTTLSSVNSLGRDITAAYNQGFNSLNTAMLQGFNEMGRDTLNATNMIINGQNALSSRMAECCCEIKSTITADGAMTRALITDNRMQDLQAALNDAKNQISDLNQTNALIANNALQTNTILQHLSPFVRTSGMVA